MSTGIARPTATAGARELCCPADMLDVICGVIDAYVWFIAGPRAIYRLVRRIRHPSPEEKAAPAPRR